MHMSDPALLRLPIDRVKRKLKVVVLESFYDCVSSGFVRDIFGKILKLKINGYQSEYPNGVLPVDAGDFIGTHLLVCEETPDGLDVLMGFKSVTHEKCLRHKVPFPVHHILGHNDLPIHRQAIENYVDSALSRNLQLAYNGSWTVRPDLRDDKDLIQSFFDFTVMLLVRYYGAKQISNIIAGATLRFGVEKFKIEMGWQYLKDSEENVLAPFPCEPFSGEIVSMMTIGKFSEKAKKLADRLNAYWDSRIVLDVNTIEDLVKKAA